MPASDIKTWVEIMLAVGGVFVGALTTWALLRKDVADLKQWKREQEEVAKGEQREAERQRQAWWETVDELRAQIAALDKVCATSTAELRSQVGALEHRVDLHSGSNVANLAGVVKNYNEMLIQTLDTMRDTLREGRK